MPMTPEQLEAGNVKLPFGQYKGSSLWWVYDEDPDYVQYLLRQAWIVKYSAFYADLKLYIAGKEGKTNA
jgi:hypothetical protein